MSEPTNAIALPSDLATLSVPSMFEANTNNILGGAFAVIHGNNNIMNFVQNPAKGPGSDIVGEILEMLETFVEVNPWAVHNDIQEHKTPDTGVTFMSRRDIQTWIDTPCGVIWLKGGPGIGKTYLVSTLFDQLYKRCRRSDISDCVAGIAYLQFNAQMSEWEIVMGLIIQLVACNPLPAVLDYVRSAFADFPQSGRRGLRAERPTLGQLCNILGDIIKKYRRCYIFIDGLDEMKEIVREGLIKILSALEANILVASRDLTALEEMLARFRRRSHVTVEITAEEKDLDLYIAQVIQDSDRLTRMLSRVPQRQAVLVSTVKTKSKGMFLHVKLQMEALRHCLSIRELFEVIEEIPEGIRALYSETLKRIARQPGRQAERAKLTLIWILHAHRPLSVAELQHAMAAIPPDFKIDLDDLPSKEDLFMICCGLLTVDKFNKVCFLHLSAQEILPDLLSLTSPAPHATMAQTCLSVLSTLREASHLLTLQDLEEELSKMPLLEYAYSSAPYHCRRGIEELPELELSVAEFISSCQSFPFHHPLSAGLQHLQPLHVACKFGLRGVVKDLLNDNPEDSTIRTTMASGQSGGWSSLIIASASGHSGVVKLMMKFFVAHASEVDASGMNMLLVEALEGHPKSLVQALLEDYILPSLNWTPSQQLGPPEIDRSNKTLIFASTWGLPGVVRALLATPGLDINFLDQDGQSALIRASSEGHIDVVELLLAVPGIDTNLCDKNGNSALIRASWMGHTGVVRLLLAAPEVEPDLRNKIGISALVQASNQGHTDVVRLLLDAPWVDVNARSEYGDSALMRAAYQGYADVVKLLLAHPWINLNFQSSYGDTALMLASCWGHPEVVRLLLATPGIDLDIRNKDGKTALEAASESLREHAKDSVELLTAASLGVRS